jgi:hypothetical protein
MLGDEISPTTPWAFPKESSDSPFMTEIVAKACILCFSIAPTINGGVNRWIEVLHNVSY